MPIHFYSEHDRRTVSDLKEESWDLPTQMDKLELWVKANRHTLKDGPYIADIGFMVREDAGGGGAVLTHALMQFYSEIKLTIYFSEYVGHREE